MFFLFAGGYALKKVQEAYAVQMVTCVIRPEQLDSLTHALEKQDWMFGMTLTEVRGFGRQKGDTLGEPSELPVTFRLLPKIKVEILVRQKEAQQLVDTIVKALRTGEIGDGKIVVYKAVHLMRIRTGEKGLSAVR